MYTSVHTYMAVKLRKFFRLAVHNWIKLSDWGKDGFEGKNVHSSTSYIQFCCFGNKGGRAVDCFRNSAVVQGTLPTVPQTTCYRTTVVSLSMLRSLVQRSLICAQLLQLCGSKPFIFSLEPTFSRYNTPYSHFCWSYH